MMPASRSHRLARKHGPRRLLVRNLVTSLILYESIQTVRTRARTIQPLLERMLTHAKSHAPHVAIRALQRVVFDRNASRKMMEVLVPRFQKRSSGFTRIRPLGRRLGDGAEMVEISLLPAVTPKK